MRILLQNSLFHPNVIGGAEQSSWLLGLRLSARGHHVDAVATTGRRQGPDRLQDRALEGLSGRVYEAPSHGAIDLLTEGQPEAGLPRKALHHALNVSSRRWRRRLDALIAERRPDVVHTNTIVGMTGVVWQAAAAAGVPVLHTLRDYHLLCPRTTLLRSSGEECESAPWPCLVYRGLKGRATGCVDLVTAPSNFVLQRHLDHGQFSRARSAVVPNACPPPVEPIPVRDERPVPHGVYLGQLDAHKGVDLILDTLRRRYEEPARAPLDFSFAGVGPLAEQVRSFCGQWSRVRYHGFVDEKPKDRLLREADFVVVPSRWNDNFPRVMLDAFRYGLPVIGSRRGGIPEVVEHEANGLLIEPTVDELDAAFDRLIDNPSLQERLGARAHADAARYGLEAQVDRFEELYRELCAGAIA